jgi:lysozyme family protein
MPAKFSDIADDYAEQWAQMQIEPGKLPVLDAVARKLIRKKPVYQKVEARLGVPWFFIAVLHNRESGANFAGVLHNGEHIIGTGRKTRLVPAGRGPFESWEEAAIDALTLKGLQRITDWSIERICYEGERFNGWGYRSKGVPSAYLWSFSNIYKGGKYVADHVWSSSARDQQAGIMPLLKRMMVLDPSIGFGKTSATVAPAAPPVAVPPRAPAPPAPPDVEAPEEEAEQKPASQSKTLWMKISEFLFTGGGAGGLAIFGGLDWRVALAIVLVVAIFTWLIVRERLKKGDLVKGPVLSRLMGEA